MRWGNLLKDEGKTKCMKESAVFCQLLRDWKFNILNSENRADFGFQVNGCTPSKTLSYGTLENENGVRNVAEAQVMRRALDTMNVEVMERAMRLQATCWVVLQTYTYMLVSTRTPAEV